MDWRLGAAVFQVRACCMGTPPCATQTGQEPECSQGSAGIMYARPAGLARYPLRPITHWCAPGVGQWSRRKLRGLLVGRLEGFGAWCHLLLAHNPHDSLRCAAQSAVPACDGRAPRGRRCWWTMTRPSTPATGPTTPAWALTRATASSERCPRARSTIQRCAYAAACTNVARARVGLAPPAAWADTRCVQFSSPRDLRNFDT